MTLERDKCGRFVKGGHKNPNAYTWKSGEVQKGGANRKGKNKENDEGVKRQADKIGSIMHNLYVKGVLKPRKENPKILGENHPNWKGDNVGYGGVHDWIREKYGTPSLCDKCGDTNSKRYEWANITGEYTRDRKNWQRLCVKCHRRLDLGVKNV